MITCNLGKILKRRNINISKIAKETGISRTTITSLIKGGSNGIKFETLSTLCEYLEIPVAAIIETTTTDNGMSVEKFMRLLIENSHYATSKVKIKSTKDLTRVFREWEERHGYENREFVIRETINPFENKEQ